MATLVNFEDDNKETNSEDNATEESTDSEEETPEDQTDNSEEESTEDDNEGVEGDEVDDDGESIAKQYFTDPSKLDPKLAKDFKQMQAVFTRKMQAASAVIRQAQAMELLIKDPEFVKWARARKNALSKGREDGDDSDGDEDDDSPITRRTLRREMAEAMRPLINSKQEDTIEREAKEFKRDNPDWKMYKHEMDEVWENNPDLNYQDCYDLAVQRRSKVGRRKQEIVKRKGANIGKPNSTGARQAEKQKKKMSLKESFFAAIEKTGVKLKGD